MRRTPHRQYRHGHDTRRMGTESEKPRRNDLHRPARPLRHYATRRGRKTRRPRYVQLRPGWGVNMSYRRRARYVNAPRKNPKIPTGDIEVAVSAFTVLNRSEVPPFTIEEHSDGGDELRMKYRYLDLRRPPLQRNILLRHRMAQSARRFSRRRRLPRNRDAVPHPLHAGRGPRLRGPLAHESRRILRPVRSRRKLSSNC